MADCTRTILHRSDLVAPLDTVLIKTGGNDCPLLSVVCDEAALFPGALVRITQTAVETEVSMVDAGDGQRADRTDLFIVEVDRASPNIAYGTAVGSIAYADTDSIKVYEMKIGMEVWIKGSTLTVAMGEYLVPANNGVVTNVGDPDGAAINKKDHVFMALADMTSGTWIPARYMGQIAYDDTP